MTPADFETLLKLKMGLDAASVGVQAIDAAVRSRIKACGLDDSDAYWALLQESQAELQELIEAVVVPETWFFRGIEAFAALVELVEKRWRPANPGGRLRLLSLPCSTGEEPYSIAMALLDAGLPEELFQIDAVDISARSLERAREGIYGRNSFRGQDLSFRDRYFEPAERGYRLSDPVRRRVRFLQGNLLDDALPAAAYDFVFCRNVLIYFDRSSQDRAVHMLDRLLKPNGTLFIGTSEGNLLMSHGYASAQFPLAFAFERKPSAPRAVSHAIQRSAPKQHPSQPPHRARSVRPAARLAEPPKPQAVPEPADVLDEISRLADQGALQEAMRRCQEWMRTAPPSARAYYLMGLIQDASGKLDEACRSYRKALYLEPDHREALVHLALLLEQQGDAGARQFHQRARRLGEIA